VIRINNIYGSSKAANLITDKNNIGVAFSATAALTNPNWINSSGYTISSTITPNDTAINTGTYRHGWLTYDSEAISTDSTNDIEFQLNGSTFYTATGYAQSTLSGYFPVSSNYFGTDAPAAFVASKTSSTYTWKLTNGASEWQKENGMDTYVGFNDTINPGFQQSKWMFAVGIRSTNPTFEIWRWTGVNNIDYTATVAHVADDDEISIVYNS